MTTRAALGGEAPGHDTPDPGASARDDDDTVLEAHEGILRSRDGP